MKGARCDRGANTGWKAVDAATLTPIMETEPDITLILTLPVK